MKLSYKRAEQTGELVVHNDPNSGGSEAEIVAQTEVVRGIQSDLDSAVTMINRLELVRGQLSALRAVLASDTTRKDVRDSADSLDKRLLAVERKLFQTRITGRGQDLVRWPFRTAEQLAYLGQVIGGSDFGPTQSQRDVARLLHEQVVSIGVETGQLLEKELAAFNEMLRGKKLENVIAVR